MENRFLKDRQKHNNQLEWPYEGRGRGLGKGKVEEEGWEGGGGHLPQMPHAGSVNEISEYFQATELATKEPLNSF